MLIIIVATASIVAGWTLLPRQFVPRPDFAMQAGSSLVIAGAHKDNLFNFTLKSLNGFTGVLFVQVFTSFNIVATRSDTATWANSTLVVVDIVPRSVGNETFRIVASSGALSHSMIVPVVIEDRGISFNPAFNPAFLFPRRR